MRHLFTRLTLFAILFLIGEENRSHVWLKTNGYVSHNYHRIFGCCNPRMCTYPNPQSPKQNFVADDILNFLFIFFFSENCLKCQILFSGRIRKILQPVVGSMLRVNHMFYYYIINYC